MNLPNLITMFRIFLVPVFMLILLIRIPFGEYIAAGVFILAASTDGLDGYIARSRKQVTRFGKLMDPLADKLLVSAALICLVELHQIPAWVAVLIIGREFAVSGLRSLAAAEGVIIAASKLGKVKTITQIVAISAILLNDFPLSLISIHISNVALYVALIFTIVSGVDYYLKAKKTLRINME